MFWRWRYCRALFCTLVLAMIAESVVSAQESGTLIYPRQYSNRPSRMKVTEIAPQKEVAGTFTIVGAIPRSGVYTSTKANIPLDELMKIAGGLGDEPHRPVYLVRDGQIRIRLTYFTDRANEHLVMADDIVVVVPRPGEMMNSDPNEGNLIPIVCTGLESQPVILEVPANKISDIDTLLTALNQSPNLKASMRQLQPIGGQTSPLLLPGTILFFNPQMVDRTALSALPQVSPGSPFPASIPLEKVATNLVKSDLPEIHPDSSYGAEAPELLEETLSITPSPPPLPTPPANQPLLQPVNPDAALIVSSLPNDVNSLDAENSESLQEATEDVYQPADLETLSMLDLPLLGNETEESTLDGSVEQTASTAPAPPVETTRTPEDSIVRTRSQVTADVVTPQTQSVSKSKTVSPFEIRANQDTAKSKDAILPIAIGVGLLGLLCLGVSILWSRYDHRIRPELSETPRTKNEITNERPKAIEQPSAPSHTANSLSVILNQTIPMIEEEVILPAKIQLHGTPTAQRKLILHDSHKSVPAPHFLVEKNENSPRAARSSKPKPELQTVSTSIGRDTEPVAQTVSEPAIPQVQAVPETALREEYDIVEPVKRVEQGKAVGALERALRSLSQEKQS